MGKEGLLVRRAWGALERQTAWTAKYSLVKPWSCFKKRRKYLLGESVWIEMGFWDHSLASVCIVPNLSVAGSLQHLPLRSPRSQCWGRMGPGVLTPLLRSPSSEWAPGSPGSLGYSRAKEPQEIHTEFSQTFLLLQFLCFRHCPIKKKKKRSTS